MRYPDGGGLTAEQRRRREEVRMRAVDLFEEGAEVPCVARELRVSEKSVYQWRRTWRTGGRGYERLFWPQRNETSGPMGLIARSCRSTNCRAATGSTGG